MKGKTIEEIYREQERKKGRDMLLETIERVVKQYHLRKDRELYFYKQGVAETEVVDEEARQIKSYISTRDCDRQGDIMMPEGAVLDNYRKNPVVLWMHSQDLLPIGKNLWIRADKRGLIALTQYRNTAFAEDVWKCRKEGLLGYSIGYIAIEEIRDKQEIRKYMEEHELTGEPVRIVTKWELLEYSDVLVPANPWALEPERVETEAMKQFFIEVKSAMEKCPTWDREGKLQENQQHTEIAGGGGDQKEKEVREMEIKKVIPYEDYGYEKNEKETWDAGREVTAATVEDLKQMCAWYDAEKPEVKASYKLPHHRQKDKKAIWRGVVAAMAALFGARGGVDIPEEDREGVYKHLAKHYEHWDKTPPEFRSYTEEEIQGILEDEEEEEEEEIEEKREELTEEDARIYKAYALLFAEGDKLPKMKGYSAREIIRAFPHIFMEKEKEKEEKTAKVEDKQEEAKRYITKEQAEKIAEKIVERMARYLTNKEKVR